MCMASISGLDNVGQICWTCLVENGLHDAAQFELYAPVSGSQCNCSRHAKMCTRLISLNSKRAAFVYNTIGVT